LARSRQHALLAVAEQTRQLSQRDVGAAEIAVGLLAAHLVDECGKRRALRLQLPLQGARMHRKMLRDQVEGQAPGGQHPADQQPHRFGDLRIGRYRDGVQVVPHDVVHRGVGRQRPGKHRPREAKTVVGLSKTHRAPEILGVVLRAGQRLVAEVHRRRREVGTCQQPEHPQRDAEGKLGRLPVRDGAGYREAPVEPGMSCRRLRVDGCRQSRTVNGHVLVDGLERGTDGRRGPGGDPNRAEDIQALAQRQLPAEVGRRGHRGRGLQRGDDAAVVDEAVLVTDRLDRNVAQGEQGRGVFTEFPDEFQEALQRRAAHKWHVV